jgi:hypothetical protein
MDVDTTTEAALVQLRACLGTDDVPLEPLDLAAALRAAEARAGGRLRDLWGSAAATLEAAVKAEAGDRPRPGELLAVALDYAQVAIGLELADA